MVIDKWTRNSNNNNSLSIPLLGHKSKETFAELKKKYEYFKNLNHKFKKYSKNSPPRGLDNQLLNSEVIDYKSLETYIDKIHSILISINELLSENNNFKDENSDDTLSKEIYNITDKILSEYNTFVDNAKQIQNNIKETEFNNTFDFQSLLKESKNIADKISKYNKKDKNAETVVIVPEERNNDFHNFSSNIDRGQINIFTNRREYNNSVTISKNDLHYSIEEEGLNNGIKLSLFFMIILFVLFICYICII